MSVLKDLGGDSFDCKQQKPVRTNKDGFVVRMLVYLGNIGQLGLLRAWKKGLESCQGNVVAGTPSFFVLCLCLTAHLLFFLLPLSETGFLSLSLCVYFEQKIAVQKFAVLSFQFQLHMEKALVEFNSTSIFLGEII